MPKRLEPAYSEYVQDEDDGGDRHVFVGHLRIVRSARRARALRKRGVEVDYYNNPLALGSGPTRFWVWYETVESYDARAAERKRRALLRRSIREAQRNYGLDWAHALLRNLGVEFAQRWSKTFLLVVQREGRGLRPIADIEVELE